MIVRLYKAKIRAGKEKEWEDLMQSFAVPLMKKQSGLVDAFFTWDTWGKEKEFAFVSVWKSLDDIKKFAGKNWDQPVIPEEEKAYIISARVDHFEPVRSPK